MSLEAALSGRSVSPAPSSGRSTPVPKASRRAEEDGLYKNDKALRKYAAIIERALSSWEISPEEWADYIAFLGRLLKAIQSRPKDVAILPHSANVASKLSQCMNPALPSGVHQKALEVYSYVFSIFGQDFVSDHLDELLPGLSAVLSFASLSVRPALYELLEDHIIPLSVPQLRPLLKSLVLSLLPALEEETSEDFERAFRLLEALERKFALTNEASTQLEKSGFFWQCLFLAVITSPPRRQGALNYLVHKLPRFEHSTGDERSRSDGGSNGTGNALSLDAEIVVSPEPGLLIRAFVCGLSDPQLLIQRGFLDLLVTHLPLSSPLLQARTRKDDLERLVSAAMHVLLRREMSLNRRLWSWFLGPEPKTEGSESQPASPVAQRGDSEENNASPQLQYFASYGKLPLERSVLAMFKRAHSSAAERARPFRLCLSLMDRWEIGGSIVPEMFLAAIESAYEYSLRASAADTTELLRSASLFFDSIEASLIWSTIMDLVDSAFETGTDGTRPLRLCRWIVQNFNIKDEEMLTLHVPRCIYLILAHVQATADSDGAKSSLSLELALILLEILPSRALPLATNDALIRDLGIDDTSDFQSLRETIHRMYQMNRPLGNPELVTTRPERITCATYRVSIALSLQALRRGREVEFTQCSSLLSSLHSKAPSEEMLRSTNFVNEVISVLEHSSSAGIAMAFPTIASLLALVSAFLGSPATKAAVSEAQTTQLEFILTPQIWPFLSPRYAKYHVEATRAIWQIHDLTSSSCQLEATLTALVRPADALGGHQDPGEAVRRFAVLWCHSVSGSTVNAKQGPPRSFRRASTLPGIDTRQSNARQEVLIEPLLLILDKLSETQNPAQVAVRSWLQGLPTLEQVFKVHFDLLDESLRRVPDSRGPDSSAVERENAATTRALEYILGHFLTILRHGNDWIWDCLSGLVCQNEKSGATASGLVRLVEHCARFICDDHYSSPVLEKTAIATIELSLSGPHAASLWSLELDSLLIDRLLTLLDQPFTESQSSLLRLTTDLIKLRTMRDARDTATDRPRSRNSISSKRPSNAALKSSPSASSVSLAPVPPTKLLLLLRTGFASATARPHLDKWLEFLAQVLPIFSDAIFSGLIPLVECLCKEMDKAHAELISASQTEHVPMATSPEPTIMALLEATEMILARAHRCLDEEEPTEPEQRPAAQSRGLLGNVASGVFKSEAPPSRTAHANSRLTVILTFQDAIRVSLRFWIWASRNTEVEGFDKNSAATTSYNALRVRNRTRHLLEQIFAVEPLESLEVVMSNWRVEESPSRAAASMDLLHVLQGTRPKNVIPAILDALCSRTNPAALPTDRLSTKSIELTALDVALFLSAYLQSTEDDAMDEVWPDCMAFLRDVLSNPLPYRQVLPALLLTVLLLAQKIENTNFGEQRKMRKELGDSFNRLLTATFTTMPSGYTQDPRSPEHYPGRSDKAVGSPSRASTSLISALKEVVANIEVILETADRAASAMTSISANLIGPMFKAKSFPHNMTPDALDLLLLLEKKAPQAKPWKKELHDAFNDPRLLTSSADMMQEHWFPVLYQWWLHDKERISEVLGRLVPPSSAGIMFGVGANAARLEADRKAQLNLRRICILMLASPEDTFAAHMRVLNEKLAELFDATTSSSPSAAVKAELFMLCRAIVLSTSSVQLAPMWPIINDNLHAALASLLPEAAGDVAFANLALLQACKLLDLLITTSPDEFQLHEWLYITDTIDAVYQPAGWDPSALSDQIAIAMASDGVEEGSSLVPPTPISNARPGQRRPLLDSQSLSSRDDFKAMARDDFAHTILRPFLSQLSMYAYEAVYAMDKPDVEACRRSLLEDLLDLSTVVE